MNQITNQINNPIVQTQEEEDDGEGVLALFSEIKKVQVEWKNSFKRLPDNATLVQVIQYVNKQSSEISGTILSLLRDLSHYSGQQYVAIVDMIEDQENPLDPEAGTQFLQEDANKFSKILAYAKTVVEKSLQHSEVPSDQKSILSDLHTDIVYCENLIEGNTISEEDDSEPEGVEPDLSGNVQHNNESQITE